MEWRSDNAEAILHSPETKLLDIRFRHDVDTEVRKAWQESFEQNLRRRALQPQQAPSDLANRQPSPPSAVTSGIRALLRDVVERSGDVG